MLKRDANYIKIVEKRGRKLKIMTKDIRQIERILEEDDFYARALT